MRFKQALNGRNIMSFCFLLIGIYVIRTAIPWPTRTGLFPLIMGIVFTAMFALELGLSIFTQTWKKKKRGGYDFKFAEGEIDEATIRKRTRESFGWMLAYFFLVLILGFVYAIPVFFLFYIRIIGKESWKRSALVTGIAFAAFYMLFIWGLRSTYP